MRAYVLVCCCVAPPSPLSYTVLLPQPVPRPYPFVCPPSLLLLRHALTGVLWADDNVAHWIKDSVMNPTLRAVGRDWPRTAVTMVGLARLHNTQWAVQDVIASGIAGDFLEAGVWRGGVCILVATLFRLYAQSGRVVWVADSFAGLPPPNATAFPSDKGDTHHTVDVLAVSLEQVIENFRMYGLDVARPDAGVAFVRGFFNESLAPLARGRVRALSVLRVDGDLYESTWEPLVLLYPKLSIGGFVICDDVQLLPSLEAVLDYRRVLGLHGDTLHAIDMDGAFWRRSVLPERIGRGPVWEAGAGRLRWPLRVSLLSPTKPVVYVLLPLVECVPGVTVPSVAEAIVFATALHLIGVPVIYLVLPLPSCVALTPELAQAVASSLPPFVLLQMFQWGDGESGGVYDLHALITLVATAKGHTHVDAVLATGKFVPGAASPPVCQIVGDASGSSVSYSGVTLEYVDPASGAALYLQQGVCDASRWGVAKRLPDPAAASPPRPTPVDVRDAYVHAKPPPLRPPAPSQYATCVVLSVFEGTDSPGLVELMAVDAVTSALAHTRFPRHVAVAPVGNTQPRVWADNIQRLFVSDNVTVTAPSSRLAQSWNAGVAALSTSGCGVYVFLTGDAVTGATLAHLTDAAANAAALGPYFPLTNAPRQGSSGSALYARRAEWEARWETAVNDHSLDTEALGCVGASGLGYRTFAAHAHTLTATGPFVEVEGVDFRDAWLSVWQGVCGGVRGGSHVVKAAAVWHDCVSVPTPSGYTRFPNDTRLAL